VDASYLARGSHDPIRYLTITGAPSGFSIAPIPYYITTSWPGPLRIEYTGALYHLTSRGDRQEAIFDDDQDRSAFLNVLSEVVSRFR
jgi:hypothetical protein